MIRRAFPLAGLLLLALIAWPYLWVGPRWLTGGALLLPFILGMRSPVVGIGLLLGLAPVVDGIAALILHGSPESVGQVGMGSWIEPLAVGLMAGIITRGLVRDDEQRVLPPGVAFFVGSVACSLGLSMARFWPAWHARLPVFVKIAWLSIPNANPVASEHTLRAATLLVGGAVWLSIVARQRLTTRTFHLVAGGWLAGSLVAGIYGTVAWFGGWDRHLPFSASLLDDKNSYGSYLVLSLFMAWAVGVSTRSRGLRLFAGVTAGVSMWMLLLCGSKIALMVVAAGGLVTWVNRLRPGGRRVPARILVAGLLVVVLMAWGSLFIVPSQVTATLGQVMSPRFLAEYAAEYRLPVWIGAGRAVLEHPLLGLGPGLLYRQLGSYYLPGQSGWRPLQENAHNQFLQLAAETGLVGLVAFVLLLGNALREAFRRDGPTSAPCRLLATGLLCYLATALTGHPLLLSRQVVLFWAALGLTIALSSLPDPSRRLQPTSRFAQSRVGRWLRPRWVLPVVCLIALLTQPFQRPCAASAHAPGTQHWDFAAGFYPEENGPEGTWHWMKSAGQLTLCAGDVPVSSPDVVIEMASFFVPREVTVSSQGHQLASRFVPAGHPISIRIPIDPGAETTSLILEASPPAVVIDGVLGTGDTRSVALRVLGVPRQSTDVPPGGSAR